MATLYFGGHLGRMADDYSMLRRDPVSGVLGPLPATFTEERPYFIRPVYFLVCRNLITLAYGHEWSVHVLMALVHGLGALLLYLVLRRASLGVLAASAAGLLFVVVPQCHESVFWMAAMGNDAALVAFLVLALVALRRPHRGPVSLWLAFVLAFHVACWNESAAAAIAALPLLLLAARPADEPFERAAARAAQITGACVAAVALYLVLYLVTVPAGTRGSPSTLTPLDELGTRLVEVFRDARRTSLGAWGRELVLGALIQASEELRSIRGGLALGALAISGAAFAARWASSQTPGGSPSRLAWLASFGGGVVLLGFVPIVLLRRQPLASRLWTMPSSGLAILAGCGLEALLRAAGRRGLRWPAGVLGTAVAAWSATLALGMVGLQALYRANSRLDRGVPEQLVALIPDPPPETVFVLLDARARAGHTGQPHFDGRLFSAWHFSYAIGPLTREVFARDDLGVTALNPPMGLALQDLGQQTFTFPSRIDVEGAVAVAAGWRVPWRQAIPFVIGARGEVTLVRRVWLEDPRGNDVEVSDTRVPPAAPAAPSFVVPADETSAALPPVAWRRGGQTGTDVAVRIESGRAFGLERSVLALGGLPNREQLTASLEASSAPSMLVLRIGLADGAAPEGSVRLTCGWASDHEPPLARLELSAAELAARGRWAPFRVPLPVLAVARSIYLEIACDRREGTEGLLITPGVRLTP